MVWCGASFKPLDDDHATAAAGADMYRLLFGSIGAIGSIGPDCVDGIDGNDWRHEQLAGTRDVLGAFAAGEQAIISDAVEACGQHVDEKAADELGGSERHHLVAVRTFEPVVLPLEGDAFLIASDQAAI